MTSMPASRRARAITLAPRSWPSRPGLAMTTRSFLKSAIYPLKSATSYHRNLFVLAPDLAQRVAHLADRRIGADRIEDGRHDVLARARDRAQPIERALDAVRVARPLQPLELRELFLGGALVDVQ